jgi:uncharacterized protein (DUF608 family)
MTKQKTASTRILSGPMLDRTAFPMGGMGAGMICLEGNGGFSHVSLRHHPEVFNEPWIFAGLHVKTKGAGLARILEGPVPAWRILAPGGANGLGDKLYGLPRFSTAKFSSRFPFGTVTLSDKEIPVKATITGWSPFIPGDADNSSLPVIGLEYALKNTCGRTLDLVFSFHSANIIRKGKDESLSGVYSSQKGMTGWQAPTQEKPWLKGWCSVATDADNAVVDAQWFRGGWFDAKTILWKNIAEGAVVSKPIDDKGDNREGASIYVPVRLAAGEVRTIRIRLCWYVPQSDLRAGFGKESHAVTPDHPGYQPWYAKRFSTIEEVSGSWADNYDRLRRETETFTRCFYDSTLPAEVIEAVAANLSILKSPSVLRQADGRLWVWEGCCDSCGCCNGSCTHVLNYAQAVAHLFPAMERTLRQTEFNEDQNEAGHQNFRARLPIETTDHGFHAAADGQLGGIMKIYREWRICGSIAWLQEFWPKVRASLDYCIETWDPRHRGVLEEPHHNTYDIEFWGPDGMCTTFYIGALFAAVEMANAFGDDAAQYADLYKKGRIELEKKLFNGEYFIQQVVWEGLSTADPTAQADRGIGMNYSAEAKELLEKEGPKYQYGNGCLSDGVLGVWMALVCGLGEGLVDSRKVASHVRAVYKHNFKKDLSTYANPQRPSFALGKEAGLLLGTWPRGGALTLPFVYSNEVWTGIEYQVASHLMMIGEVDKGLDIVRAVRARYDGRVRNPFDEYECGHWYTRALASYAMLQALTGIRYDAVDKTLHVAPRLKGEMRSFLSTEGGYGTVSIIKGVVAIDVAAGSIPIEYVVINGRKKKWPAK